MKNLESDLRNKEADIHILRDIDNSKDIELTKIRIKMEMVRKKIFII